MRGFKETHSLPPRCALSKLETAIEHREEDRKKKERKRKRKSLSSAAAAAAPVVHR